MGQNRYNRLVPANADGSKKNEDAILDLARTIPHGAPLLSPTGNVKARLLRGGQSNNVHSVLFKVFPKGGSVTVHLIGGWAHIAGKEEVKELLLSKIEGWTTPMQEGTSTANKKHTAEWLS